MCDIGIGDTGKEAYGSTRSYSRSPTSAVNSCCRNVQDWDPRHAIPKSHAGADCVFRCPASRIEVICIVIIVYKHYTKQ